MKSKIVLFSVLAVLALFAVSAVPSASANGQDNEVYFVPEDSYGRYCENIPVLIMVDAVNLTRGAGMDIYFDPACVNITNVDFTGTPYSTLTGWTHEGNYVHIGVMGPMTPIPAGTHLIANLTLHCENEAAECSSDLLFKATELLDYDGSPLPNVIWYDGTFSCGEVPCIPGIEVNKTVWDKESQAWVDETTAQMSENVRFRCEIHNDGTCLLTGIVAKDILSDSLRYADNATVNGNPKEPEMLGPNEFRWAFPMIVLMPCQTITIEFDTQVIGYGYDCNVQSAIAMGEEIEVSDEDTACVDVPNGQDNEVYFVPEDSYGLYCENIPVLIMVDTVDLTRGAGMDIYFDPACVNITDVDFTGTPYSTLTGWTHEGNYVHIGVMEMTPIQAGTYLIANLTLHCENEAAECSSDLLFKATELLDDDGDSLPNVIWHDGTFTCVDKPDLNVTKITLNCGYLFANESNEICAKIENIGGEDAGAFNVSFDIDGFSTEVGIAGLAAGENTTVCINDTTIRNAGDSVTITVTADCDGEVDESDETNNELILDTTVVNNGYKGKRYTGGEDINTWDTFTLNGNLIYSSGDSYYLSAYSHPDWTEYNVGWTTGDLPIPGTATVTEVRLFVPYTWDKSGVMPAYAAMSFNGNLQTLDAHYSDEKGWGTSYPYGMLVYDVTADFKVSGNVANLTNSYPGGDNVSMRGMLLVVVYADSSEPERTILMNEGFDLLYGGASKCTTPEEATAYAPFGLIDTTEVQQATLITVAPGAGPDEGDLGFNTQMWYDVWNFVGSTQIGIAETDVTAYLQAADNEAYFRSSADYMEASNAFLILEIPKPDLVISEKSETIVGDELFNITYTVANIGCADAGPTNTTIQIDTWTPIEVPTPAIVKGENYTNTVGPFECPCGETLTISVCADNGDVIVEKNETNNCKENELECPVCPLKPDLVITDEWLCWPDNCTICYNVTNIGEGTAHACHNTTLYVDGVAVAHDHVPVDLAPGESYIGCFDGYVWAYTLPSDNITVCADNNETVDELDEDNNCLTNIWMCGDVNCDGEVTISDVRKVFNRYLDPNYLLVLPWAADVHCDGEVTMSDVRKEFNRYLDPEYDLNCCCE